MKASERISVYQNADGARISVVDRRIIRQDGLIFKDIDGSGTVSSVNDWRLSPEERAAAYVQVLSVREKIAQLFISDWRMAAYPAKDITGKEADVVTDASGLLDEGEFNGRTIFGEQHLPGTSVMLKDWFNRHLILRANASAEEITDWLDQLQAVAESCEHFIPVQAASNSRNENGEIVFGMNDAAGVFPAWPGTLGIAAAVRGRGLDIIDRFASAVRREWDAVGLKKGYMYMADVVTDPRWQRTYGTFGEDPALISEIFDRLVPGIQGGSDGVTKDGVAMTVKHFPGGGPRENGFDPHYRAGQWNVYAVPGSLQAYHLPPFKAAAKHNPSSIMPYYSKPAADKSGLQTDENGNPIRMDPYGFAYNRFFIDDLLRRQMGFAGYINSDTGIVHNMCWGVEALDTAERIGFAVTQSGVDLISGLFDNEAGMEAYRRGAEGYYRDHAVPEGFRAEDLVLTDAALDRAVTRTLTEMFALGMFDDPYRDPAQAIQVFADTADRNEAMDVHRKSVVLLKNDGTLPLKAGKVIYAEAFAKREEDGRRATEALRAMLHDCTLTDDPAQADIALLMVSPSSGEYFSATKGYLELAICENKTVCNVDDEGRPVSETHTETTLSGADRIPEIAAAVHAHGGRVAAHLNITLAWMPGGLEPYCDALTAGFDTLPSAVLDVLTGQVAPVGKLPLTLPRGDEVLAVDASGRCVSPNDVPGYAKDAYMPDSLKDENGKAYAYRDAAGNYYELDFGLRYTEGH